MRVAFLGTSDFAVPSLHACVARGDQVAVVVTQPDRPGSRGRPAPRPVADAAQALGLRVWQPPRLRDPATTDELLAAGADLLVVASYGQILPARLLDGVRCGGVNVHASLLPRWRGASPVAAAILAGDERTGVCIMRMEAGLDTGPVYACEEVALAADATTPAVLLQLAELGAALLPRVLAGIEEGTAVAEPQDDALATHAPLLRREDGVVDWARCTAVDVDRRVRALQPWPGTVAQLGGLEVRLVRGAVAAPASAGIAGEPGTVVRSAGESVIVAARDGAYRVDEVQPPGRRAMSAGAYLRGRRAA